MSTLTLRKMALKCADRLGVYRLLRRRRQGAIGLAYHGVEEKILDERIQGVHLPLSLFEEHVDYIARNFEVVSLAELAERLEQGRGLDGRQVVLTFDDGYRNNLYTVAPVLRSAGLPFSVFICTDNIDRARRFTTYYLRCGIYLTEQKSLNLAPIDAHFDLSSEVARDHAVTELSAVLKAAPQSTVDQVESELYALHSPQRWAELDEQFISDAPLNWEEVKVLDEHGVCIGSHGRTHSILHDKQDSEHIRREIRGSREKIIQHLGRCDFFAYPNGRVQDVSGRAVAEVDAAGYRLGFSSIFREIRQDSPRTLLPRIDADEDLDTLKFYLHSAYHPRSEREECLEATGVE